MVRPSGAQRRGPDIHRQLYAGHRKHAETGLVYMQARWYDPGAGTFLSVDPVVANAFDPQSLNAYAYARNNPVNVVDPTGMCGTTPLGNSFGCPNADVAFLWGGDGYEKALAASFDMVEFDALDNLVGPYDLTHRKKKPVGVEYADAGDFTPEQLAEARKMIADAQNVHPGVMPGYDNPYPVESEALGRADRKIAETAALGAAGVVAPEAAALARGSITASRFVAAADFFNNATGGYSAGYTGQPFSPTTSSFAARWGAGLGWGAGAFQRTIGINRAVKFVFGLFE